MDTGDVHEQEMAGNMLLHCLSTGKDIGSLICNVGASAAAAAAAPAAGGVAAGGDSKPEEKEEAKKEESEESSDEDMGFGMCIFILLQRFLVHNLSALFSLCRSLWLKRMHNCYQAPHAFDACFFVLVVLPFFNICTGSDFLGATGILFVPPYMLNKNVNWYSFFLGGGSLDALNKNEKFVSRRCPSYRQHFEV